MHIDRGRVNENQQLWSDRLVDRGGGAGESNPAMSSNGLLIPSSSSVPSTSALAPNGAVNYIEHPVSKMDTLAGVAIKYGVEVADIRRMNGLVTDRQMFALKSLQIPLPGRHPPSPSLSNGSSTLRESRLEQTPPRQGRHSDILDSFQSLRLKSTQRKVSPAMNSLQGYYGLKPQNHKGAEEGMELAVYRTGRAQYLEDEPFPRSSPFSDPPPGRHRKSRSVNGFFSENGELAETIPVSEAGDSEAEKSSEKSVRRRQKSEADNGSHAREMILKEDSSGGSGFSVIAGKGLALRPKSASRTALAAEADLGWLNPIPVGLGDSLIADGFGSVRKSSSASNLQDEDHNTSLSIWPTSSKRSLKSELQALSNSAITKPFYDGLPKPITARRNKAALD